MAGANNLSPKQFTYTQYPMLVDPTDLMEQDIHWLNGGHGGDYYRDKMLSRKLEESQEPRKDKYGHTNWGGGVMDAIMNGESPDDPLPAIQISAMNGRTMVRDGNHRIAAALHRSKTVGETYIPAQYAWNHLPGITGSRNRLTPKDQYDADAAEVRQEYGMKW